MKKDLDFNMFRIITITVYNTWKILICWQHSYTHHYLSFIYIIIFIHIIYHFSMVISYEQQGIENWKWVNDILWLKWRMKPAPVLHLTVQMNVPETRHIHKTTKRWPVKTWVSAARSSDLRVCSWKKWQAPPRCLKWQLGGCSAAAAASGSDAARDPPPPCDVTWSRPVK